MGLPKENVVGFFFYVEKTTFKKDLNLEKREKFAREAGIKD